MDEKGQYHSYIRNGVVSNSENFNSEILFVRDIQCHVSLIRKNKLDKIELTSFKY